MPGERNGSGHDVVVVGASAGGIEALKELVGSLPADLEASLFVVLHMPAGATSVLPAILTRAGPLPAEHVEDGVEIALGRIYVAPPDCHLELEDGRVAATTGPKENGHRPAIDPLFRSAANVYGPRVVGVILSGTLDDGTLGLRAVKAHGGATLVQDPADAQHSGMPRNAIALGAPDRIGRPVELAAAIVELAAEQVENVSEEATMEEHAEEVARETGEHPVPGEGTGFTCPGCGGAIWRQEIDNVVSFRCRVGHKYSAESFAAAQAHTVESAVWSALRLMEERVVLMRNLAEKFEDQSRTSRSLERKADVLEAEAVTLRGTIDSVARAVRMSEVDA
jgi:two-component system chemotaxis response regulator CheB